jgi:hypothetical protein
MSRRTELAHSRNLTCGPTLLMPTSVHGRYIAEGLHTTRNNKTLDERVVMKVRVVS